MNPISQPSVALTWPHWQRLAERWLRRWGYALAGLVMGLGGMWLAEPEVGEAYTSALQAQSRLVQQLEGLSTGANGQTPAKVAATSGQSVAQAHRLLSTLPVSTQPESLWIMWQQTLAAHDLRLQFLKPIPPIGTAGRGAALVSHAATWRVLGRFDDWARVWAACAESGPVCANEGISVVATQQPGEVQIDAVMRVWMRSAEGAPSDELTLADWMADMRRGARPPTRSHTALFAPSHSSVAEINTARSDALVSPTRIEGLSVAETGFSALSDDPKQWPLARIRLVGLWQAGDVRQAVLSAGPHTVRVTLGQSISLEGHRVVAITDQGVLLRSGTGPTLELPWAQVRQVGGSGGLSAGNAAGPPIPSINLSSTTGSSPQ